MALSKDELNLIGEKLEFSPDYIRFRSVCKTWRLATLKRPQIPWLMVYSRLYSDKPSNYFTFYDLSLHTNNVTPIPKLFECPLLSSVNKTRTPICIGSSHGWLVLLNHLTSCMLLFNPLTNTTIDLPSHHNLMDYALDLHIDSCLFNVYLTSDPGESLNDCFVFIYCHKRILYCKVGSSDWIEVQHPEFDSFRNVQFCYYHGKLFFALVGDVFIFDFGLNPTVYKIYSINSKDTGIEGSLFRNVESFMVKTNDDLLLVLSYQSFCACFNVFQAFKLEFECKLLKLVELKCLGDKALFLSPDDTISVTAAKYLGCKENHIYYFYYEYDVKKGNIVRKMGIYDFKRKYNVDTEDKFCWDSGLNVCTWFMPSLLT